MLVIASISFGLMDSDWATHGKPWYYFGGNREVFIALAAGTAAALLAVIWALFIYKPHRRHSHRRHLGLSRRPGRLPAAASTNGHNGSQRNGSQHRRQWRRKRREHRPRNPTLAERGGLPPMRPENPSEPLP
jgi:hypothetical protein